MTPGSSRQSSWTGRIRSPGPSGMRVAQKWNQYYHHQILLFLIAAVSVVEFLRPHRSDVKLSIALDLVTLGILASAISNTTLWLKNQYSSHFMVHLLLNDMPWIAVSSTEMALIIRLLEDKKAPKVGVFLLGSAYAKLLMVGPLSLLVQVAWPDLLHTNTSENIKPRTIQLLGYSGALVLACAMGAENSWISLAGLFIPILVSYMKKDLPPDNSSRHRSRQESGFWTIPVAVLVLLKAFAIWTVYNLLGHLQSLTIHRGTSIYLTVLPLAAVLVDHAVTPRVGAAKAWDTIISIFLWNYFYTPMLAKVAGRRFSVASGQAALGVCLIVTAVCLGSFPIRVPLLMRGMLLLAVYSFSKENRMYRRSSGTFRQQKAAHLVHSRRYGSSLGPLARSLALRPSPLARATSHHCTCASRGPV
ncbi:hypothetical protein EK21DRAFT_95571 [Setomelanomma holmii]|uniref:Uncharacterized protein n=1 Tax=Setomelanomma holmii TaxID=210430 RepID=A0A9P4GW62_9PLEO|nr:hypothetical protein EK21DRAFT_95571 [Setomelanomma holmii]